MQRVITQKNTLSHRKSYTQEADTRGQLRALLTDFKNKKLTRPQPIPHNLYLSHRNQISEQRATKIQNSNKNCKFPQISPKRKQLKVKQLNPFQHHIISNYLNFSVKIVGSGSVPLKNKKSSHKSPKNKLRIKLQKEKQMHQTTTMHQAELQTVRNRQNFHSIESKKEYSLREEPMKHYVHQKMERKKRQWKEFDPLQLQTYFAELARKMGKNIDKISQKTMFNPKMQKFDIRVPPKNDLTSFIKKYVPKNNDIKMLQLIKKPNFCIQFGENSLYFGQFNQGIRQGMGIQIRNNYTFQGQWKKGMKVKGVEINQHGKYNGYFYDDKKEGKGQFRWPNGQFYSGQWRQGKRHGVGMWTSQKGDSYMGEWKKGVVEGQGVHKSNNGQKYQGGFKNFLKHGFGMQSLPNGDKFEGEYLQGLPHGNGSYQWASGPIYQGNFVKGYREGAGTMKTDKGFNMKGHFRQQRAEGECDIDYGNGQVYRGSMKFGKRNGKGTLRDVAKRKIFEGYWKNNQFVTLEQSK